MKRPHVFFILPSPSPSSECWRVLECRSKISRNSERPVCFALDKFQNASWLRKPLGNVFYLHRSLAAKTHTWKHDMCWLYWHLHGVLVCTVIDVNFISELALEWKFLIFSFIQTSGNTKKLQLRKSVLLTENLIAQCWLILQIFQPKILFIYAKFFLKNWWRWPSLPFYPFCWILRTKKESFTSIFFRGFSLSLVFIKHDGFFHALTQVFSFSFRHIQP